MEHDVNEAVKSNRDLLLSRLKEKYPEREYKDDEELFSQIGGDYDQYEQDLEGYKSREKALSEMFISDPRSASFLQSWRSGEDPAIALIRMFGENIREALDDPEKQEELAEANREFVERVAKNQELEEQYQINLSQSMEEIDRIQAELGLSEEEVEEAMTHLMKIVSDGVQGRFTADTLKMVLRAINYDADIQEASHTAEVRGRNAKIEETVRKRQSGDGMPQLGGGSVPALGKSRPKTIFEFAEEAR